MKPALPQYQKQAKPPQKRKLQMNISDEQMQKSLKQYQQAKFNNTLKGSFTMIKWDFK